MPITAITCWIGALALIGTPFFSGFYSKDLLIEAVGHAWRMANMARLAGYAHCCVMAGVFVTAFYTFRMLFMTFHGKPRWGEHAAQVAFGAARRPARGYASGGARARSTRGARWTCRT